MQSQRANLYASSHIRDGKANGGKRGVQATHGPTDIPRYASLPRATESYCLSPGFPWLHLPLIAYDLVKVIVRNLKLELRLWSINFAMKNRTPDRPPFSQVAETRFKLTMRICLRLFDMSWV